MYLKVTGRYQNNNTESDTSDNNNNNNSSVSTLSISSSIDQIYQYYNNNNTNNNNNTTNEDNNNNNIQIKEELIEINNENDILELKFIVNNEELSLIQIPIEDIYLKENWLINTSTITLSIKIQIVDRVPKDWFETSLDTLTSPRRYFKAEDIYSFIKHIFDQLKTPTLFPVVEVINFVDYASLAVGNNLLSLRLNEGFSLVSQIDDLITTILGSFDKTVDKKLLQLVLSLQQLRKSITQYIRKVSFFTQEKLYLLKSQVNTSQGFGILDSAYIWATVDETTNKVKNDILQRIQELRDAGRASIASIQSNIYSRVTNQVNDVQKSLLGIPALAHPYVIGAVEASQPYINGAITTATPIIQTIREKTPVDNWINDTKEVLERNGTVGPYVVAATQVLEEVKNYCTDQQYFEHQTTAVNTTINSVEVVATVVSEN